MDPKQAAARHAELVGEIRAHDYRYYVLDDPIIGDRDYDALYAELRELERAHPSLQTPDSPTQRVGDRPRTDLKTVPHVVPMMSLDNTYTEDDLADFVRRVYEGLPAGEQPGDASTWHQGLADEVVLKKLVEDHHRWTGSLRSRELLDRWVEARQKFVKVFPHEYKRALAERAAKAQAEQATDKAKASAATAAAK